MTNGGEGKSIMTKGTSVDGRGATTFGLIKEREKLHKLMKGNAITGRRKSEMTRIAPLRSFKRMGGEGEKFLSFAEKRGPVY